MEKSFLSAIALVMMVVGLARFAPVEAAVTGPVQVLSAIDVATLMEKGSSAAEIAQLLSEQYGIDRNQMPFKGKSDDQLIKYLVTNKSPVGGKPDKDKSMVHSFQGDRFFRVPDYEKAAREYSAAIALYGENADLYKKRGDSYRLYLAKMMRPSGGPQADVPRQSPAANARNLMCYGINQDYSRAKRLINDNLAGIDSEINAVRYRMGDMKAAPSTERDVLPYYTKAAERSQSMRQMQVLSRAKRTAAQASSEVNKALADYKTACSDEDETFRTELRKEMDSERESKWMILGEIYGVSYFYDKISMAKSKNGFSLTTRAENYDYDKSYVTAGQTLNCARNTLVTSNVINYDEHGSARKSEGGARGGEVKIIQGTVGDLLSNKFCGDGKVRK